MSDAKGQMKAADLLKMMRDDGALDQPITARDLLEMMARDKVLPQQGGGAFTSEEKAGIASAARQAFVDPVLNLLGGAVRGAGSIGATILAPVDMARDLAAGKGVTLDANRQRRAAMDAGLQAMGADPDSIGYGFGKLAGEIAGTAGAGGLVADVAARAAPALAASSPELLQAIRSGGFTTGAPRAATAAERAANVMTRATGGAVAGGATAGLVNPEDAGTGAVIGAAMPIATAASGALGGGVRNMITGGNVRPEVRALALRARELGIDPPLDRLYGSRPLNALAAGLDYIPFSGREGVVRIMDEQVKRALSRTFGQDGTNIEAALTAARPALGAQFDAVLQNNAVRFTPEFDNALTRIAADADRKLVPAEARIIHNQIDDIRNMVQAGASPVPGGAPGEIDGQAAYGIKRSLDEIGERRSNEAHAARQVRNALMDALNASLTPEQAAAFATTRRQWGNMRELEKLSKRGAEGDVSMARVGNINRRAAPDLGEIADIAAQFVKPREGAHGASQRATAWLTGGGIMGAGGATGGPVGALTGLIGSAAVGRALNGTLSSSTLKHLALGLPVPEQNLLYRLAAMGRRNIYLAAPVLGAD